MPAITIRYLTHQECDCVEELALITKGKQISVHEILDFISQLGNAGLLAVQGSKLVGYLLYTINLQQRSLYITQWAIHPMSPSSTGRILFGRLLDAIPAHKSKIAVEIDVPERDLATQRLLKELKFQCIHIAPDPEQTSESLYIFQFCKP
jgi:hypothetical protein